MNLAQFKKIPCTKEAVKKHAISKIGVYVFLKDGVPLYIGKSVNIKARLLSHFEGAKTSIKESRYTTECDTIACKETPSEFQALLLESQLIQSFQPRYNARWKDNKSYLYIKITIADEFPKVYAVRKEQDKKSIYFGPFPSLASIHELLQMIRRIVPFCTQKKISRYPCFYSKINLCDPCPNGIAREQNERLKKSLTRKYQKHIKQVIAILEGKPETVVKQLQHAIKKLSAKKAYEEAIIARDQLFKLERIMHAHMRNNESADMHGSTRQKLHALQELLGPHIQSNNKKRLAGPKRLRVGRIECFDVSNLSGKEATASMVVAENGSIAKNEYKKFKIKRVQHISDFDMLEEAIERRLKNRWKKPNLIIVDGGKPQVQKIQKLFKKLNVDIPLIGIAKNPDRLVLSNLSTIRPAFNNAGFQLLRALRDESHRFARKYHIQLRSKQ